MAICRKKRGDKVYLAEYKSIRVNGKVKHIFVRHLGVEGKDGKPIRKPTHTLDKVGFSKTLHYGATSVLWEICKELDLENLINENIIKSNGSSTGKLLISVAINKIINPLRFRKIQAWIDRTNIPELMNLDINCFAKHTLLRALDNICGIKDGIEYDFSLKVEKALFENQGIIPKKFFSSILYDTTPNFYYGETCDLAEKGYNSKKIDLKQIKVALCVTQKYHIPIFHLTVKGSMMDALTSTKVSQLVSDFGIKKPLILWDRGITTLDVIRWAEENGVHLIVGVKNNLREVKHLLDISIEEIPANYITTSEGGAIYAIEKNFKFFKKNVKVIVYKNCKRALKIRTDRHEKVTNAIDLLDQAKQEGKDLSEVIKSFTKNTKEFIIIKQTKKGILYKINEEKVKEAEKSDGRYAIICTDLTSSKKDAINSYFGKNEVERAFRVLKDVIDMDTINNRIPTRVKSYFFVCYLSYYLYSVLEYKLREAGIRESVEEVMDKLNRIEKVKLKFGKQTKEVLLNLGTYEDKLLRDIKMQELILVDPITRPTL